MNFRHQFKTACAVFFAPLRTSTRAVRIAGEDFLWHLARKFCRQHQTLINTVKMAENVNLKIEGHKRNADFYRAQLMQLRVAQRNPTGVRGRTGWMVSVFIPDAVVAKLRDRESSRHVFCQTVAETLVQQAINGILYVNRHGNVSALIFADAQTGEHSHEFKVAGAVFETAKGSYNVLADEDLLRAAEHVNADMKLSISQREAKKLGYKL